MFHPMMAEQIVDCAHTSFACSLPAKFLRCGDGYQFRQLSSHSVMLMHGDEAGPVISCGCAERSCEVRVDPLDARSVLAVENACHGNWSWTVRLPGIAHAFKLLALESETGIRSSVAAFPHRAASAA